VCGYKEARTGRAPASSRINQGRRVDGTGLTEKACFGMLDGVVKSPSLDEFVEKQEEAKVKEAARLGAIGQSVWPCSLNSCVVAKGPLPRCVRALLISGLSSAWCVCVWREEMVATQKTPSLGLRRKASSERHEHTANPPRSVLRVQRRGELILP